MVERINQLCKDNGTTIKQLEIAIGIGNGVIRKWDISCPRTDTLQKVADYFNVSVDYLLGRETEAVAFDPKQKEINEIIELYNQLSDADKETVRALAARMAEMNKQ